MPPDNDNTDPGALYTGGRNVSTLTPGRMFANEGIAERDPKNQEKIAEQQRQAVALYPWAAEIMKEIDRMRAMLGDFRSYAANIYTSNGKPTASAQDIEIEFKAREITLKHLQELETWVIRHSRKP